jgi:hypothetical protein
MTISHCRTLPKGPFLTVAAQTGANHAAHRQTSLPIACGRELICINDDAFFGDPMNGDTF